jgi:hypothetical protein
VAQVVVRDLAGSADGLAATAQGLRELSRRFDRGPDDVGPPVLRRSLEGFDDAWRQALRLLADETAAAAALLHAAGRRYAATEDAVRAAVGPARR